MRSLYSVLVLALAFCVIVQPVGARMKPVAAGKVESATEKRERILKAREESKREAACRREQDAEKARREKARAEEEAAQKAARMQEERARAEEEASRQAELSREQEKQRLMEEHISRAGLVDGWKNQKGIVRVDEVLKLVRPLVVCSGMGEARRYLAWLRADEEAARQFAMKCVHDETAFIIPEGSSIIITRCDEEDEDDCVPTSSLFYVSAVDGTEGWASNLILRQHRAEKKKP